MAYQPVPLITYGTVSSEQITVWVMNELQRVAADLARLELVEYHAAPSKPFHGMRVIADGTDWNPGSGRGVYWYDSDGPSWVFLG